MKLIVVCALAASGCGRHRSQADEGAALRVPGESASERALSGGSSVASSERCIEDVLLFDSQTCFRFRQGFYWCRGDRGHGQLGNPGPPEQKPTDFLNLVTGPYRQLVVSQYACGLGPSGRVACWGNNLSGFIQPRSADGSNQFIHTPVPMPQLGDRIDAISTAHDLLCVLRNGEVSCAVERDPQHRVEKVQGLPAGIRAISTGPYVGCAATADEVYCWGQVKWARSDKWGSVHSNAIPGLMPEPLRALRIDGPRVPIAAFAVGGETGAVLTTEGRVYFFGSNEHGEWGTGAFRACSDETCVDQNLRELHELPSLGVAIRALAMAAWSPCALGVDGSVWCWGYDGYQAVTPPAGPRPIAPDPLPAGYLVVAKPVRRSDLGTDNVRVLAGAGHYCAVKRDGAHWCWGSDFYGQLGQSGEATTGRAPFELEFPVARCTQASH